MIVRFSKSVIKFIDKATEKDKERLRQKIRTLLLAMEEQGAIPFREVDIKKLSGEWTGFLRMRVGKIRVISGLKVKRGNYRSLRSIIEVTYTKRNPNRLVRHRGW